MTLTDLKHRFLDDFRSPLRGRSLGSAAKYESDIEQFVAYVLSHGGKNSVQELTPERIEGFVQYCGSVGNSGATVRGKLSALSALARFGMKVKDKGRYVLAENPVDRIERPRAKRPRERYLYKDEFLALLNVEAEQNEKLALAFLFDTRLRASAAAHATTADLSLDGDRVRVTVVEKGDNPLVRTLSPEVAEPLLASLKQREVGPGARLLLNCQGQPYNRRALSEMVARLARRAGITRVRVGAHLFARHSWASLGGQSGMSVFEIAAGLGHRDTSTAKRYVHGVDADAVNRRVRDVLHGFATVQKP